MSHHFITKCKYCEKVMGQCRCPSREKKTIWEICSDCANKKGTYFTDFGEDLLCRNEATGDIVKVGRYAYWVNGEVVETSFSFADLQHKYGTLPIHKLEGVRPNE